MSVILLVVAAADAHIALRLPEPRYTTPLKDAPCGKEVGDARSMHVTQFAPGETITVQWKETVDHDSHFRISFDADGTDDFVNPGAPNEFYTNDAVLLDDIPDEPDLTYAVEVTLPDVTCTNCTLQVIQLMYDSPPYDPGPGSNDLYFQCADLELVEGGGTTDPPPTDSGTDSGTGPTDPGTTDSAPAEDTDVEDPGSARAGCGCTSAPRATGSLALFGLALLRRRR